MNKRGWIAILTVVMLGVIIGVVLYSYVQPWEVSEIMGEKQAAILDSYSVGEQARVYIKDAAEVSAQQALDKVGAEDLSKFEEEFLFHFEQYLNSYELPSYEEDDIYTLYDIFDPSLHITVDGNKIVIINYPWIETYKWEEENEEGELIETEYEYESAIEIGSDTYGFDYILDPYFRVELDIS